MKDMDRHMGYWSRMWSLQMCESPRKLVIGDTPQSEFNGRNRYRAALTRAQPPHWMAQRFHSNPQKNATLSCLCQYPMKRYTLKFFNFLVQCVQASLLSCYPLR